MNKGNMGWVVAALLAVVLGGALVFQMASDDSDTRPAAAGDRGNAQEPPPDEAENARKIKEEKEARGKDRLPALEAGQQGTQLDHNPQGPCNPDLPPNVFAEWRNQPQNLNAASGQANQIVVGTVQAVEAGPPLTTPAGFEPGGEVRTPVQRVTLRVDDQVRGQGGGGGGTVTIESLGDEQGCYRVAGDPPYRPGQQYLLLLESGQGGRPPHTISPAGRYLVAPDKILQAMENNPFMSEVAGRKLAEVVQRLRGQ